MSDTIKTDKASLDAMLDNVVELLNDRENSEAMEVVRSYFGLFNRWVCVSCGRKQVCVTSSIGCDSCSGDMRAKVVRTKEIKP